MAGHYEEHSSLEQSGRRSIRMPIAKGPVRARDLRANIAEHGFENGVVMTLEALLDEHTQDRQHLREMAALLDQCMDHLNRMMTVGTSITQKLDQMKRERDQGDAIDHGDTGD
jgi:hypothetical protein